MRSWPMLMLRGTTYYYRRSIPLSLRPLMGGKREIWRTLRTTDRNEAQARSLEVGLEVERDLQAVRKQAERAQTDPQSFARQYESRTLAEDAAWWRKRTDLVDDGTEESVVRISEQLDAELDAIRSTLQDHKASLRMQDTKIVSTLLDAVLQEQGLHVPPTQRREFALALLKAQIRLLEVDEKRTSGQEIETDHGVTVGGLLEAYAKERQLSSKSDAEVRAAYRRFSAIVGEDTPARSISKSECRVYKESLFSAPSNRMVSKDGKLSPKSVRKLMGIVSTIFRYGVSQGLVDSNPFEGITRIIRSDAGAGVERRLPFDAADLKALFGSEAFSTLTGAQRWVPLIALYSAMRVEEVCGLRVSDLRTADDITYFSIEPHESRRLKTDSSRRQVPVHHELIRLGLLDYTKTVPQAGLLFPELKPGPHGKLAGALSKWWARYSDQQGVTDPRKVLHSTRHTVSHALRTVECPEEVRDAIGGWASSSVSRGYGAGVPLAVKAKWVAMIRYEGVTLTA